MIRVFRVFVPKVVITLILGEIILTFACFIAGIYLSQTDQGLAAVYLFDENGIINVAIAVTGIVLAFYFQNLYGDLTSRSRFEFIQQLMMAIGAMLILQAIVAYVDRELMLPRWAIVISTFLLILVIPAWRFVCLGFIRETLGRQKLLFLGTDARGVEVAKKIAIRPELGLIPVGFVDNNLSKGEMLSGFPVLGPVSELRNIVDQINPGEIVVNLSERRSMLPVDLLLDLRYSGIRIVEVSTLHEVVFGRVSTQSLRPSQLIFSGELGPSPRMMKAQTIYSFVIAVIGLVVSFPIMVVVALLVKATSPGPVMFSQKRVGLNGEIFTIFKFRSMGVDAEAKTGAVWATKNDPRVTPVGAILRKTRLDELLQIFNVLRGDMVIVGPRPERPEFVSVLSEQIPFYRQRHVVKPGVTGWAQINYKYGETIEDTIIKLEYDLYYIKNLAPSLDMFIIFDTLKVMLFSGHGQ